MKKKLKAAIIGLGQVGILFDEDEKRRNASELYTHFSAYQTLEEIYDLVAVVDSDISKFEFAKNRIPDIACFSSIENMLIKKEIDVVSICTPDDSHLQCLQLLIGKVKGVFIEKPICGINELNQTLNLIAEAKRKNLSIRVNYYKTTEPLFNKAMAFMDKQDTIYLSAKYSGPFDAVGSHALHLLVSLTSSLEIIKSFRHSMEEGDGITALFQHKKNCLSELIYCGSRHQLIFELDILSKNSRAILSDNFSTLKLFNYKESPRYQGYNEIELISEDHVSGNSERFIQFLKELALEIKGGQLSYYNLNKAIETQELMDHLSRESLCPS